MPKVVDAGAQRREIRAAARRVFARRGIDATGLTHVAAAAGMGRSSLYHYYPDKAALVRDLARDLLHDEEALFTAILHGTGTPLGRIERLVSGMAHVFEEWAAIGRVLFDLRTLDTRRFRAFFRRVRRDLADVIEEGQAAGEIDREVDAELAGASIIGAIDGLLLQRLVDAQAFPDAEALSRALLRLVRTGLRP